MMCEIDEHAFDGKAGGCDVKLVYVYRIHLDLDHSVKTYGNKR